MRLTRVAVRRYVKARVEARLDARLVRGDNVGQLLEQFHLRRFFAAFEVDCVFDVGANRGQYATMLREEVEYRGPIVSFEPVPAALEVLREAAAGDPDWYVVGAALGDAAGVRPFNVMKGDQFSSMLTPSSRELGSLVHRNTVTEQIEVDQRTLTDEVRRQRALLGFARPFLKLDTQGNDLSIAAGGEEVLSDFAGIQTEMAIKRLYEGSPDLPTTLAFFQSRGFDVSALVPNNRGHFPILVEIDGIFVRRTLV